MFDIKEKNLGHKSIISFENKKIMIHFKGKSAIKFSLNDSFEEGRPIPRCEYFFSVPPILAIMKEVNSQTFIVIARKFAVIFLKISYLKIDFDVIEAGEIR